MAETVLSIFSQRGEKIYAQKILPHISIEELKGKFIAIEVDSGKYYIDSTIVNAIHKAQQDFPEKEFYLKRIGYRAVHSHKGVVKKAHA